MIIDLINSVIENVKRHQRISPDDFMILEATFGNDWSEGVLEYLDYSNHITKISVADSDSEYFAVHEIYHDTKKLCVQTPSAICLPLKFGKGHSGPHLVRYNGTSIGKGYCSCNSWLSSLAQSSALLLNAGICKHLLAVYLRLSFHSVKKSQRPCPEIDIEFSDFMQSILLLTLGVDNL